MPRSQTTWLHRHLTGEITKDYTPTVDCEVRPVQFTTVCNVDSSFLYTILIILPPKARGLIQLDVWDVSGSPSTHENRLKYLENSDAALVMFDYSRKATLDNVINWCRMFQPRISEP